VDSPTLSLRAWEMRGLIRSLSFEQVEEKRTPLQISMDELAKKLSIISFAIIGVIVLIGVFQKRSWLEMFTIGGEFQPVRGSNLRQSKRLTRRVPSLSFHSLSRRRCHP